MKSVEASSLLSVLLAFIDMTVKVALEVIEVEIGTDSATGVVDDVYILGFV